MGGWLGEGTGSLERAQMKSVRKASSSLVAFFFSAVPSNQPLDDYFTS